MTTNKEKDDRKSKKGWFGLSTGITEKIRDSMRFKATPMNFDEEKKFDGSKYILKYDAVFLYQDIEDAFYEQLKVEFNTSPMDFIREFREIKQEMSDMESIEITRRFISNYIKPQSPNELNISGKARNKILTKLKECDQMSHETKWVVDCTVYDLFLHIDKAMKKDLQIDSFPRFTDSKFWLDLLPKYRNNEDVVDALTLFDTTEEKAFERQPSSREIMDEKLVLQFLNRGRSSPRKIEKPVKQRKLSKKKKSIFQRKSKDSSKTESPKPEDQELEQLAQYSNTAMLINLNKTASEISNGKETMKKVDSFRRRKKKEPKDVFSQPPPKPSAPAPNRPAPTRNAQVRPFFPSVIVKQKEEKPVIDTAKRTTEKVGKLALLAKTTSSPKMSPTITPETKLDVKDTIKVDEKLEDEIDFDELRKKRINDKRRSRKDLAENKLKKLEETTKTWEMSKDTLANIGGENDQKQETLEDTTDKKSEEQPTTATTEEPEENVQELPSWYYSEMAEFENDVDLDDEDPEEYEVESAIPRTMKEESEEEADEEEEEKEEVEDDEEEVEEEEEAEVEEEDEDENLFEKYADDEDAKPIDKEKAEKYFQIAVAASKDKEYQKAIDHYDLAIEYDCELKEAYFNRGVLNYSCHRYLNAILDMVKVIKKDPNDGRAFSTRGRALKQIGQYKMAIEDFNISNELADIPSNWMLLGICHDKLNMKTEAIDAYSKFINTRTEGSDQTNLIFVYCNRALNYYQKYQYEQALHDYTCAIKLCKDEKVLRQIKTQRAKCHKAYGNIQQANADLQDSYTDVDYYNNGVHAVNEKNYAKAYDNFTQAINLKPNDFDYYHARAMCSRNLGNLHDAIFDVNQSLKLQPNQKKTLQMLAKLYVQVRSLEKAIEVYTTLLELFPKDERLYFERANIYGDLKNQEKAIENYTIALEMNPEMSVCYFNRGLMYFKSEDYKKALSDYTKAIQYDDENASLYVDRGLCYYSLSQNDKAVADFRYCLQLDPDNSRAKDVLQHFE